jgi:predicted phosphohydrolase
MNIFGPVWEGYWEKIVEDWKNKVTDNDIVLIAGDISWAMKLEDAVCDINEINKLPGKKIFIRGNHDYWWKSLSAIRTSFPENCYVIQNDSLKIENCVFCGTRGWMVPESDKVSDDDKKMLNREELRLELSLKSATQKLNEGDKLICMIHYPPFNSKLENSKFTSLLEKYNVNKCVYGHLHGENSRGVPYLLKNNIEYFLTSCDKVQNKLVLIYDEV